MKILPLAILVASVCAMAQGRSPVADPATAYTAAAIYSMEANQPRASAIAVEPDQLHRIGIWGTLFEGRIFPVRR